MSSPGPVIAIALRNYRDMWQTPDEGSPAFQMWRACIVMECIISEEPRAEIRLAVLKGWAAMMLLIEAQRT